MHAAIAIHPNEAVLHGHRGAPGPDGLPIKYKPWHDIPFDEAMAEVHRLEVVETMHADGAPERTVFHSYSGDAEMGEIARKNGWYLSLSGTSSYKGNDGIRESAKLVGMSHVMVETDAPYLSPMPYRGRTNAPYMIPYTLQALADYLDRPLAEIAKATRNTTRVVYGI